MVMRPNAVKGLAHENFPAFLRQKKMSDLISLWTKGKQQLIAKVGAPRGAGDDRFWTPGVGDLSFPMDGQPFMPKKITDEYHDIAQRAPDPWARLIVTTLAQTAYIDGVRRSDSSGNMGVWEDWQRNRFDAKQIAVNRSTIGLGISYGVATMGTFPLSGQKAVKMEAFSATEFAGFYDEPGDEWASFGIYAVRQPDSTESSGNWAVRVYDDTAIHYLTVKNDGGHPNDWTYLTHLPHPMRVPPFVRFCNSLDLEGDTMGEIEPIMPMLRRIDQDTFDRLIVQRFGAWKVRYVSGMAKPATLDDQRAASLNLRNEDLLVAEDYQAKFGTLDATDPGGFVNLKDADLRCLAAVTQTPPHHLLGLSANLQAEALAAAEAGLMRKSADFKTNMGESYEQFFRLIAAVKGDTAEKNAFDMQVRWRDTESRSLVQTANALSLLATQLHVPFEMLWEKIPGWTDQDAKRAKSLAESDSLQQLLQALADGPQAGGTTSSTGGGDNEPKNG